MLENIFTTTIERTGISALAAALQKPHGSGRDGQQEDEDADGSRTLLYEWRGRFRRLPEDYRLSNGSPRQMWSLWVCGSPDDRIPPLRYVQSTDIGNTNTRKRFSDLRFLMSLLEKDDVLKGLKIRQLTSVYACTAFDTIESTIAVNVSTRCNRVRRTSQLSWRTVVNELSVLDLSACIAFSKLTCVIC